MQVITKTKELDIIIENYKKKGKTIGLVPTMGALHNGHVSLFEKARKCVDIVIVSIFVNPTQFGENEDFDKYPRIFEHDIEICKKTGCDIIFHPTPSEMYPNYNEKKSFKENLYVKENSYIIKVPEKYTNKLCGKSRPGHFDGVCTIVLKLFNIVKPNKAFFGEKDIQQLIIIKNMCKSLNLNIEIIGCPIIREENGLAMSSRNSYLTIEQKKNASSIIKVLNSIKEAYLNGQNDKNEIFKKCLEYLHHNLELEYLELCDYETLDYSDKIRHNTFIAIAVHAGNVRLIDNVVIK